MTNSRRKGNRGQVEAAKKLRGEVIARAGAPGPDVISPPIATMHPPLCLWEVKRIKQLPQWLKAWIDQAHLEGADAVIFREDRGDWYVLMRAERLDV